MTPEVAPGWQPIRLPTTAAAEVAQSLASGSQSLDPYVLWHAATHPNPDSLVPIALEFVEDSGWEDDPLLRRLVPAIYRGRRFGTARVPVAGELLALLGSAYNGKIRRIRLGRAWQSPQLYAWPESDALREPQRLSGRVMAVIDDGCAFAHERFRRLDAKGRWTTRIRYLWDQGRTREQVPPRSGWQPVLQFGYGHDLRGDDIDALLAARTGADAVVDEDAVYLDADENRSRARELHGTHVMDLAAGCAPGAADADAAPQIIFVQLPRKVVRDTSGGWLNTHVLDALWYIHSRVADDAQLVVNLSFGAMAGPHDGSAILERAMDDFCTVRPHDFALVLPAGNAHDSDCHARLVLPASGRGSFTFRVRPTLSLYTNLASSFETPTTTELANRPDGSAGLNRDLQPQRGGTFEAGLKGIVGTHLFIDLALFNIRTRDELIPYDIPNGNGRRYFRNAGETLRRGAELGVSGTFGMFDLGGTLTRIAYTYEDYLVGTTRLDGKEVPGVAPTTSSLYATARHRFGFATLEMQQGARTAADDACLSISDATVSRNI